MKKKSILLVNVFILFTFIFASNGISTVSRVPYYYPEYTHMVIEQGIDQDGNPLYWDGMPIIGGSPTAYYKDPLTSFNFFAHADHDGQQWKVDYYYNGVYHYNNYLPITFHENSIRGTGRTDCFDNGRYETCGSHNLIITWWNDSECDGNVNVLVSTEFSTLIFSFFATQFSILNIL
jgi:hypothetical protein